MVGRFAESVIRQKTWFRSFTLLAVASLSPWGMSHATAQLGGLGKAVGGATRQIGNVGEQVGGIGKAVGKTGQIGGRIGNVVQGAARGAAKTTRNLPNLAASPLKLPSRILGQSSTRLGLAIGRTAGKLTVSSVTRNSLASQLGLQVNDRILAVNKQWVRTPNKLQSTLSTALDQTGRAWVLIERGGKQQWVNFDVSAGARPKLGVSMEMVDNAVQLTNIAQASAAAAAGLQAGDQVLEVNGQGVSNTNAFASLVRQAGLGDGSLDLLIRRNGVEQIIQASLNGAAGAELDSTLAATADASTRLQQHVGALTGVQQAMGEAASLFTSELDSLNSAVDGFVAASVNVDQILEARTRASLVRNQLRLAQTLASGAESDAYRTALMSASALHDRLTDLSWRRRRNASRSRQSLAVNAARFAGDTADSINDALVDMETLTAGRAKRLARRMTRFSSRLDAAAQASGTAQSDAMTELMVWAREIRMESAEIAMASATFANGPYRKVIRATDQASDFVTASTDADAGAEVKASAGGAKADVSAGTTVNGGLR